MASLVRCLPAILLAAGLAGCGREEIRVYNAPKDQPPPQMAQEDPHSHATGGGVISSRPRPELTWKLPTGWQPADSGNLNAAAFVVPGSKGEAAQVSITPLANLEGNEALISMIVNMARNNVGMSQLGDQEALQELKPVEMGGAQGKLFEVSGMMTNQFGNQPVRILTAFIHRPDGTWFCKISGDPELVAAQRGAFTEFLKSIRIESAPTTVAGPVAGKFNWVVPDQWQAAPPGEMQVARFTVPGKEGARAEVFVSSFPTDTGGNLANINRWRGQLRLGPVQEQDLAQLVKPLDPANPEAILVDLTNDNTHLVGAIVPRAGQFWFYKLLGDTAAVASARESFIAFAKSQP